jgi:hypothetical protein
VEVGFLLHLSQLKLGITKMLEKIGTQMAQDPHLVFLILATILVVVVVSLWLLREHRR